MNDKRFGVKGRNIYDVYKGRLNIEFKSDVDARLCCKLLNQQEKEKGEYIDKLDGIFKWYKEYYGKTILDTRMGW